MTGTADSRHRAALAGLLILASVLFVVEARAAAFHALPWLAPDSAGYLNANVARAPLYPLLLDVVARLPGGWEAWLGPLQHTAVLLAGVALAYQFARRVGRPIVAALLFIATAANPAMISYCFTVLPEALFIALLMVHLACILSLTGGWNRPAALGAGASAAAMALAKPSGYAAVAGVAVIAWQYRAEWRRLHWLVVPAPAVLLLGAFGNYAVHGLFATQAQGGYARIAYVAQLLDETTPTAYPDVTRELARHTATIRADLESLPSIDVRYFIGANQYHVVEALARQDIVAGLGRRLGKAITGQEGLPNDPAVVRGVDQIGGALANAAIRQRPAAYAYQVAVSLYGLWWMPLIQSRSGAATAQHAIDDQLTQHPRLDRSPIAFRSLPGPAFVAIRALLATVAVCGLIAIPLVWSTSKTRSAVGYVAVLLHGYFLLVSLAQPGLPRYALTVWPASMLLVFGMIAVASRR